MVSIKKLISDVSQNESARRQPVGLYGRIVAWQLWRRIVRRPMRFRTVTGSQLLLLPGASDSLSAFWYHQIPDFEELSFALHLIRANELFVDIGANQGGWSLMLAGLGARAISFEPIPITRERFLRNVRLNPPDMAERVQVLPYGLSDGERTVAFTADLDSENHQIGSDGAGNRPTINVELRTADGLLRDEAPVLLKIDVEGGELGVLRGARGILGKPSLLAIIMETFRPQNHRNSDLIESEKLLREHGFSPVAYHPFERTLRPLLWPEEGGQNTVYVREIDEVVRRLKQGPKIKFCGMKI